MLLESKYNPLTSGLTSFSLEYVSNRPILSQDALSSSRSFPSCFQMSMTFNIFYFLAQETKVFSIWKSGSGEKICSWSSSLCYIWWSFKFIALGRTFSSFVVSTLVLMNYGLFSFRMCSSEGGCLFRLARLTSLSIRPNFLRVGCCCDCSYLFWSKEPNSDWRVWPLSAAWLTFTDDCTFMNFDFKVALSLLCTRWLLINFGDLICSEEQYMADGRLYLSALLGIYLIWHDLLYLPIISFWINEPILLSMVSFVSEYSLESNIFVALLKFPSFVEGIRCCFESSLGLLSLILSLGLLRQLKS